MLVVTIAQLFKLKVVRDVIILACNWNIINQAKVVRQMSSQGLSTTFACDPGVLMNVAINKFQGVLYFSHHNDFLIEKVKPEHFAHWYKWLIIGDGLPDHINKVRYDSDITYIRTNVTLLGQTNKPVHLEDVFVHPGEGASIHPWGSWTEATGMKVEFDREKIARRFDLKKYPLRMAVPVGYYSPATYNGSFSDYLMEDSDPERDSGIRSGYISSSLIFQMMNSSEILQEKPYWSDMKTNDSMLSVVKYGQTDMGGAILRIIKWRIEIADYIMPIWPFGVGFTYLAERESSSNMYVEPFSAGVWWTCLGIGVILAICQRATARRAEEKEGAFIGVLATWLQQDASAVPEGASGRWSFIVMSISAMLVHAYYTSAIVSALMSTGRGGPDSLRALADSKYSIASDSYDYMRYLFWEVDTGIPDLEYLKKKKMKLSSLYVDMQKGIELIKGGSTAYHAEYNQIYQFFNSLHDDQLCKLQYVPTIPETLSWITAPRRGQYTNYFRSRGAWLHETGIASRITSKLLIRPPPCRTALLAERVKFGDIVPLLLLTTLGLFVAVVILGMEIVFSKMAKSKKVEEEGEVDEEVDFQEHDYID